MNISKIIGIRARKIAKAIGFAVATRTVKQDLCSNTGLKSRRQGSTTGLLPSSQDSEVKLETLSSGIDWLMGTMHDSFRDLDAVREFVEFVASAIGDTFVQATHGIACGIQWHPYLWRGVLHGSQVSCMVDDRGITHLWVSITGKSCRNGQQNLARLMVYLAVNGFCCTRIDCATSDPKNRLTFKQIAKAIDNGECTGFRPLSKTGHKRISGVDGVDWTHYCGSKNGGKSYTRIYHSVENGYVKIERQYVKRDARLVFAELAHLYDNRDLTVLLEETPYFRRICSFSISGIGFIKRISKNLSRCPDLRWWAAFKKACETEPIKLPSISRQESLEVKKSWVERSVATSLAMLKKWMGSAFSDWIYKIISDAAERLTEKQLAILHQFRLSLPADKKKVTLRHLNPIKKQRFTGNLKEQLAAFAESIRLRDEQIFNFGMEF